MNPDFSPHERLTTERVDLATVNFLDVMRFLRKVATSTVHCVEWADVYVTPDGRAAAVYQSGFNIKTRNVEPGGVVIEFFNRVEMRSRNGGDYVRTVRATRYPVRLDVLIERDGAKNEAACCRALMNDGGNLAHQRVVALPLASYVRSL